MIFQTLTSASVKSARLGSPSQLRFGSPTAETSSRAGRVGVEHPHPEQRHRHPRDDVGAEDRRRERTRRYVPGRSSASAARRPSAIETVTTTALNVTVLVSAPDELAATPKCVVVVEANVLRRGEQIPSIEALPYGDPERVKEEASERHERGREQNIRAPRGGSVSWLWALLGAPRRALARGSRRSRTALLEARLDGLALTRKSAGDQGQGSAAASWSSATRSFG